MDCVFCRIADGKSPAVFVHNDGEIIAIKDAHPVAPTHILIIPKNHVPDLMEMSRGENSHLISKMVSIAMEIAEKASLSRRGFRLVWNCRGEGGQSVDHVHLHLIGGRQMKWPPG